MSNRVELNLNKIDIKSIASSIQKHEPIKSIDINSDAATANISALATSLQKLANSAHSDDTSSENKLIISELSDNNRASITNASVHGQLIQNAKVTLDQSNIDRNKVTAISNIEVNTNSPAHNNKPEQLNDDSVIVRVKEFVNYFNKTISAIKIAKVFNTTEINSNSFSKYIMNIMNQTVAASFGSGEFNSLRDVGITVDKENNLLLDEGKFISRFKENPKALHNFLYNSHNGAFNAIKNTLEVLRSSNSIDSEQRRLNIYEKKLNAEFSNAKAQLSKNFVLLNKIG